MLAAAGGGQRPCDGILSEPTATCLAAALRAEGLDTAGVQQLHPVSPVTLAAGAADALAALRQLEEVLQRQRHGGTRIEQLTAAWLRVELQWRLGDVAD